MLDRALRKLRDGLISISYPASCHICSRVIESIEDGVACSPCWDDDTVTTLLKCNANTCSKCGAPMYSGTRLSLNTGADSSVGSPLPSSELRYCGSCTTAPFAFARSCGAYGGALEASILFLKRYPHICTRLRRILSETCFRYREGLAADIVMPIPLHRIRERRRGFNQAKIIAKAVSKELGLLLDDRTLVRTKHTEQHRAGMDAIDRQRSVESAFEVLRPRRIEGGSVLLVDDLYTTGSTMISAAAELMRAGASQVNVLTIARVIARASRLER